MNSSAQPRPDPGPERPTILVADDNEDCRVALRTLLEAIGYRVLEAGDGDDAVEVTRSERPDLVLMDIMMPGVDGLEAARRIRGLDEDDVASTRIVALSAMEGARQASLAAGCQDCVVKPIDLGRLSSLVQEWLGAD